MERLTNKNSGGDYYYPMCFEKCDGLGASSKCDNCEITIGACEKLGRYEDLEDRLNKVYGDCDGLLSKVVEMLEKHPCIDMADNTLKSRLLTDEDVDKWNEYKRLEEQGRLIKLPCIVGSEVYVIVFDYEQEQFDTRKTKIIEVNQNCNGLFFKTLMGIPAFEINDFGKTVFLTKSEAEAKLEELRGGENGR